MGAALEREFGVASALPTGTSGDAQVDMSDAFGGQSRSLFKRER